MAFVAGMAFASGEQEGTQGEAEQVTLDFVWFTDGKEDEVLKDILADYKEENPNVSFNLIEVPYNDLNTKIKTMVAGGEAPDLARVTNTGQLAPSLLDLKPYVEEGFLDQFVQSSHPYVAIDGGIVGVPVDTTANGIIYNKDYFEQAGVEVPTEKSDLEDLWTWDEWADALEKVVENSDARYGLAYDFSPHRWSTLLYQAGGQFLNADGTESMIDSPAGERAVQFFVELHERDIIPDSIWLGGENPNTLFRSGVTAMHFAGNWMLTNYKENITDFDWGVAYMPKEERRSSVFGGKFLSSFKDATHKEEAVKFLKYFASQEVNAKFNRESLFLSARKDNAELDYNFGSDMFAIFSNELAVSPPAAGSDWAYNRIIGAVYSDIRKEIVAAIQGNQSPKQAVEDMDEMIQGRIEEVQGE
jgi:alpha-1,4-digalacturonate transport system substrate-binding protein